MVYKLGNRSRQSKWKFYVSSGSVVNVFPEESYVPKSTYNVPETSLDLHPLPFSSTQGTLYSD